MKLLVALILIALLVLIVVAVLRAMRRRSSPPAAARPPATDPLAGHEGVTDVRTLRAGDMVDYGGTLFFVRGSLRLREGGYHWSEHFLDDSHGRRCWISVEEDPDLEVVLWHPTEAVSEPGGDSMEVEGVQYRLDERGDARYTSEGTTTVAATGAVEYVDYQGPDERTLSFERFDGGPWEAGLGETVALSALRVYPASSNRP
ncbi:MAG TPA: DUF4178 domain-containing protein [Pseudonocardiaceae bacterium]|nr:DUF4178 domain-containing protein [Pseudonocardiaceae bacterium]